MTIISWREEQDDGTLGVVQYLDFDATLLEEYSRAAEVTTYPVETGGSLSDHIQPQQRALSLEVFVSDTPIINRASRQETGDERARPATGLISARDLTQHLRDHREPVIGLPSQRLIQGNLQRVRKPGQRSANLLSFAGGVTRVVDVFDELTLLQNSRQVVSVLLFETHTYDNMAITNLSAPRAPDNGSGLTFQIDLIEMVPAEVEKKQPSKSGKKPASKKHAPSSSKGVIQLEAFNITASPETSKLERREAEARAANAQWDQAWEDAKNGVF
jgi:hypothetical protein